MSSVTVVYTDICMGDIAIIVIIHCISKHMHKEIIVHIFLVAAGHSHSYHMLSGKTAEGNLHFWYEELYCKGNSEF